MLEQQLMNACKDEPSLVFKFINKGNFSIIEKLIDENKIDVNIEDGVGNDVVTRLLKAKQYDLVEKLMKKKNWDVNHKNVEGNTFGHILAQDDSLAALKIVEQLTKKSNFMPNIKNNKGETVLDKAIKNNYLYTAFKFLEDKRFNDIDVVAFQRLFNACIKNSYYGKYSKINNLEVIVNNLSKKDLQPSMKDLVKQIKDNMSVIRSELMDNKSHSLESIITSSLNMLVA